MPKKSKQVSNAFLISKYFGFNALDISEVDADSQKKAKAIRKKSKFFHPELPPVEDLITILQALKEKVLKRAANDPALLYCEGNLKGSHKKGGGKEKKVNLHVIGNPKSIVEALLIKTAICILNEEGFKDVSVQINNVGGKESFNQFIKELNAYYRKNLSNMNSNCRQMFKDSAHALLVCKNELKDEILENSPSPLNFLSESNRNHFAEVIEYLEKQDIPYEINKDILGDPHYSSHTVFSIIDKKTGKILATGSRYNQLIKSIGSKKEVPSATIAINLKKLKQVPASRLPKPEKTKFFFIQIGPEAKKKSLHVIDTLRKAKIPVETSLVRERLSTQLQQAQRKKIPYILLMGQREALEGSVVVRDTSTHKQESVPIEKLVDYLNKLK